MNTRQGSHLPINGLMIFVLVLLAAFGIATLAPFAWSLVSAALLASPSQADPLEVVIALHAAVNSDDADVLLDLFADDAIVTDNGTVIEGTQQIRNWLLSSQRMAGLHLTMLHSEMNGDKITWLDTAWNGSDGKNTHYIIRWEALIKEGKIQSLAAARRYIPDGK